MKYEPEIYAQTFADLLEKTKESEQNNLIKKFVLLIKKNGDLNGSEKIITSTQNYLSKKTGGRIVNIETASKLEDIDLQKITSNFKKSDVIKIIINPELLAGIRITINNEEELDYSLARKLKKMFNKK
jgi:F0F1-type ATP synthase delta subunit